MERLHISLSSLALVAAALALMALGPGILAAVEVGQPAPALVVQELGGHTFDLGTLHGKVVIVNFWATWCPPCRQEMPVLDAFYRRYHGRGLEMVGMSTDRSRDRKDVRTLMQSFSYPAAMLNDATVNGFGAPDLLPVTFVIDGTGIVRARLRPDETVVTEKNLADAVVPLLPQEPPAPKGLGGQARACRRIMRSLVARARVARARCRVRFPLSRREGALAPTCLLWAALRPAGRGS